jgi:hypothetical protein
MGPHGHPLGYSPDCPECRQLRKIQRAKARRDQRASAHSRPRYARIASVVAMPTVGAEIPARTEMGDVERGVREQCANAAKSDQMPGIVAGVIKLAQLLDSEMGDVERGVREQCASAAKSDQMPGIVAGVIKLAQLLDLDSHSTLAPGLFAKMDAGLARLDGPRKKMKSDRLGRIQMMTGVKGVAQ